MGENSIRTSVCIVFWRLESNGHDWELSLEHQLLEEFEKLHT